jgi:hypothetical protein
VRRRTLLCGGWRANVLAVGGHANLPRETIHAEPQIGKRFAQQFSRTG